MREQLADRSVSNKSIEVARRHSENTGPSEIFSSGNTTDQKPAAARSAKRAQRPESVTRLLQHAYACLLAGDTKDARRALERALASDESASLTGATDSTAPGQPSIGPKFEASSETIAVHKGQGSPGSSPIVIKTLGTFEVFVDGKPPGAKRKPPHLLLGILKVLIANGGCSVNRSLLLDVLWPDLDGDRATDAQQVALHRLRRLLCHPDALVINHGYISINPQFVEVDAFILDTLCRNPFITGHQQRANSALQLYRGTFLPDELESTWSQRMRECMRAKFVNIIAAAGKELESTQDFAGAAALYEQALTIDDLESIIRKSLVRVLHRQNLSKKRTNLDLN